MDLVTEKPQSTDVWTDDLSVGVDIIDEDHQAFFRLADLLRDIMGSPDKNQDMLVETAINILEEYVKGHFLREETAMATIGYPLLAEHAAAHEAFAARAHQIAQDYKSGNKEVAATINDLVRRWIVGHIRTMDMQYRGVLTNENVDNRPMAYLTADENDQADGWP
ncbi:Hemerythrin-like protein [Candidatus Terasakiella magnetica]|uniref:bacteriohemerythrin n=1 Tax=Magnetospirillum sp. SS-4 TaxID=2681465 RepID=UPI001384572A|nr:bacteriohemerythrin [Magnetospirillum sp. SS-4]CAA7622124.1 Hemerythrin-like protein [Magnetospirillum sp. SS-4]CAA7624332.1 Hemerythrin-like protein [Candidatus Terasakiella magnetica]